MITSGAISWNSRGWNSAGVLSAAEDSAPLSAFVWWLIPLFAFLGAIGYVIWVSKFQSKYQNQTNRSVNRFQKFQESFGKDRRAPGTPRDRDERIHD